MRRYEEVKFYNCHTCRHSEFKNVTYLESTKLGEILKTKACGKNYYMIVYLKYDSGYKYIWAYIICGYSYKPSIRMLNSSYPKPFVFNKHDKFSFLRKVFKDF